MKNIILVLTAFMAGMIAGHGGWIPDAVDCSAISSLVLLLLMAQVGIGFGAGESFDTLRRDFRREWLLLPFAVIVGTLAASAVVGLMLSSVSVADSLAIGSGLGYYSLSSMLITQLKTIASGPEIAVTIGTIALLANVVRELIAILFAPFFARISPLAAIAAAGCSACDISLPVIVSFTGQTMVPVAIMSGVVLDMSVPLLVTFFCSL